MADRYPNFAALAEEEQSGVEYQVRARQAGLDFVIIAPHGGGIEPGTSEIADAIAGDRYAFHTLEGLKTSGNSDLHITSTRFDEPMCLALLFRSTTAVTIHGEESEDQGEGVFIGGLGADLGAAIGAALTSEGFEVRTHDDPNLQGRERKNICNRGLSCGGVQLELSHAVRRTMFESLTRKGRQHPTARFDAFVSAVRGVLETSES
jgi:phage replication-related protein YjqB (UPF0714/DUF867 family)